MSLSEKAPPPLPRMEHTTPLLSFASADAKDAKSSNKEDGPRTASAASDPVLWAMEHMNLDSSSSQASARADSKEDESKGKGEVLTPAGKPFPLPTGRPGRPPVSVNNGAPPARVGGGATGAASLLQGMHRSESFATCMVY